MDLEQLKKIQFKTDKEGKIKTKDDKNVVKFIDSLCDSTVKYYLKQHRDWYINERYARGDHWIVYNKTLNKVQTLPVSDGEIRRTVNKIRSQIRGVKNFIKRSQPRWEVHPDDVTDEAYDEAKKKNKILQYVYRTRGIKGLLTDQIVNSLKYSVGIIEAGVVKKNGEDYLDFWVDDTFNVFFDPCSPTVQECRFIIKTYKKPISTLNAKYKVKITADSKKEASDYKELLEQEKYNNEGTNSTDELDSTLVKEIWMKWVEGGKVKMKVITVSGNQLLRVYEPSYRRYPFFVYNPEKASNSIYSEAWIKDLISINKSLDKTVSQVESYIQRMLKGKWLIKQGVEVSSITDKGAEKIYYKGNIAPSQQSLQPLPSTPFAYTANLERWIEELGGMREASLGRVPGSLQSGKGVEALQAADASTVAEAVENLELMLSEMGEFCLEILSDYQIASDEIIEDGQKIKFIGDVENAPENALVIKPSTVRVTVVPEIAYSEEGKMDRMMRLAEAKLIDPQTVLEQLNFSNVGDIIERMNKQKQEEFKQEMVKQKESHRTEGEGPADTADLADQENMSMAAGTPPPLTPQALWTPEHTQLHMAFIQENQDAYQQNQEIFDEHIQAEENYQ